MCMRASVCIERRKKCTVTSHAPHKTQHKLYVFVFMISSFSLYTCVSYKNKKFHNTLSSFTTLFIQIIFQNICSLVETIFISNKMNMSLHTLPVELVYRILDHLDHFTILMSCRNVCARLNAITNTYHRYRGLFDCLIKCQFDCRSSILYFYQMRYTDV